MNRILHRLIIVVFLLAVSCSAAAANNSATTKKDPVDYVDTRIGTQIWSKKITVSQAESPSGFVYPGVGVPFAMTEWTPQTAVMHKAHVAVPVPYWWEEGRMQGFRGTHYPNGAVMNEYGCLTIMPMTGPVVTDAEKRASKYRHETEIAKPHYYAVTLDDYKIRAEVTAAGQTGFFQFTYPKSDSATVLIDPVFVHKGAYFRIIPKRNEIEGISYTPGRGVNFPGTGYFVARFEKPFTSFGVRSETETSDETKRAAAGTRGKAAYVSFRTADGEKIRVKIGTSFISMDQARRNMDREIPGWDFEKTKQKTREIWNKELKKIEVDGSEKEKTIFYTALQRALLLPRNMTEDGYYRSPYDDKVYPGVMYTDFSIWDTFRAEHPLLIFLEPDRVADMIRALLNAYDEGGWIPKWPNPGYSNVMLATHGDSVIADAYIKGIRGFDVAKAYEAILKNANMPGDRGYDARIGILDYIRLGYVPREKYGETVALTMEFAYDDFCVAQMAKATGNEADYEKYLKRSLNYLNVLDPKTKLIRGKYSSGAWAAASDNYISGWARGSAHDLKVYKWNYTLFAPHDPQGLINFFGGNDKFVKFLDDFFGEDLYYVGDEFSMHAPYMYNFAGAPWKTQKQMRQLLDYYFDSGPGGMCGNDDAGQVSSWYVFGAMGFYPVSPGFPAYQISSPVFDRIKLHLPNGKTFTVEAANNSKANVYIQSATFNGVSWDKPWLEHKDIMSGGTLVLKMGPEPNEKWGSAPGATDQLSVSKLIK